MEKLEAKFSAAVKITQELEQCEPQSMEDVIDTLELVKQIYEIKFSLPAAK